MRLSVEFIAAINAESRFLEYWVLHTKNDTSNLT